MLIIVGMTAPIGVTQSVLRLGRDTEAGVRAFRRSKQWREAAKVQPCPYAHDVPEPLVLMIHPALATHMPGKAADLEILKCSQL